MKTEIYCVLEPESLTLWCWYRLALSDGTRIEAVLVSTSSQLLPAVLPFLVHGYNTFVTKYVSFFLVCLYLSKIYHIKRTQCFD